MAITKDIENEYGTDFNYHKVREVRITSSENDGVILNMTVESYKDKQARMDGKLPTVRQCIIYGADFAMTPFYKLLKAKFPEFTGGLDDMDNSFKGEEVKRDPLFSESNNAGVIGRWTEKTAAVEAAKQEE